MSFPRYPSYKDSGVEWLGEVPEHWELSRIGYLCGRIGSGKTPRGGSEVYTDNGVLFIRSQNVYDEGLRLEDVAFIDEHTDSEMAWSRVASGDVLLNITGASIGRTCIVPDDFPRANVNQHVCVLRAHDAAVRLTLSLYLKSFFAKTQIELAQTGAARDGLNYSQISAIRIPIPPVDERCSIAAFLDRETAKIDALTAEYRTLIDLLKEKRQGVISQAVTKGLDPTVPMKDSGVEWLGEVPEHWRVGKCGFYLAILSGFAFPSVGFSDDETDTKLLRGINVGVSRLKWDETVYWQRSPDDGMEIYEMRADDLVIGMDRPLISEGIRVAKVKETDLPCLLLQRVASLKVGGQINADYLLGLLSSEMFVAHFSPDTTGVSVPHISPELISNFVIPVPPVTEQDAIVEIASIETAKLDTLTAEAEQAIALLQERRTALISAAVTGKIDVRGLIEEAA